MGSGGLVVLDDSDCMVDIARYFLHFTQDQSCGKCTFCRVGTRRMLDILDRICHRPGQARATWNCSNRWPATVGSASLCGLGKTAPNPVLSTLRYFRARIRGPSRGTVPGREVQGPDLLHASTIAASAARSAPALPGQRHPLDPLPPTHDRPDPVYALRHLPSGLPQPGRRRDLNPAAERPPLRIANPNPSLPLPRKYTMPRLKIDQREVEVPEGATAARRRAAARHRHPHSLLPPRLQALDFVPGVHGEASQCQPACAGLRHRSR